MTRGWKFQILLSRKQGGDWLLGRQQMSTTVTFGVCFPLGHTWQWDSVRISGSFPSRFGFHVTQANSQVFPNLPMDPLSEIWVWILALSHAPVWPGQGLFHIVLHTIPGSWEAVTILEGGGVLIWNVLTHNPPREGDLTTQTSIPPGDFRIEIVWYQLEGEVLAECVLTSNKKMLHASSHLIVIQPTPFYSWKIRGLPMMMMELRVHLVTGWGRITHPGLPGLFVLYLGPWRLTSKVSSMINCHQSQRRADPFRTCSKYRELQRASLHKGLYWSLERADFFLFRRNLEGNVGVQEVAR